MGELNLDGLREALEEAEAFVAEEWERRVLDATTRLGPPGIPAAKEASDALAKIRVALAKLAKAR